MHVVESALPGSDFLGQELAGIALGAGEKWAWVRSGDGKKRATITCETEVEFSGNDVKLMKKIASVYRADLEVAGEPKYAEEAWRALGPTRFLRAAARFSSMTTDPLLKRVRIFEAAAQQTYEGSPFVGAVVMTQHLQTFGERAGARYKRLNSSVDLAQALLREKWLRPFLEGGKFALVTSGLAGRAMGITDASTSWGESSEEAPVPELRGLYGYLAPGTSLLSASPVGDVYFSLPNGVNFVKSKGQWRYQNWSHLERILARNCDTAAVGPLLRLVRGASFRRHGALFVVTEEPGKIGDIVPDHRNGARVSKSVRSMMKGVNIADSMGAALVEESARIDGAVVMTVLGRILDVASMIGEPSIGVRTRLGLSDLQRFSGARTTAAWNASLHGLAIKISDDGPVEVYEKGILVFRTE